MVNHQLRITEHESIESTETKKIRGDSCDSCSLFLRGGIVTRLGVAAERLCCAGGAIFSLAVGWYRGAVPTHGAGVPTTCSPEGISAAGVTLAHQDGIQNHYVRIFQ